ncbi:MAG: hypothetical protein HUJ29_06445, partial [Gammaproteobacteria bacterium]|nr:hypothetical protein [Gammaproteobacteria bacterium]
ARKFHLHGGVNWTLVPTQPPEQADDEPVLPLSGGLAPLPSLMEEIEGGLEGPPAPFIDGTIKLIRKRFLHIEVDLLYRAPYIEDAANPLAREQWPQAFRLIESRRMRSSELHYLDHPMFGVLILATPYVAPEPEEQATEAEATQNEPGSASPSTGKKDPLSGTIRR